MTQFSLFDRGPRILFEGATGRVDYTPDLVPADVARRWFTFLREHVAWHSERRRMYEREVDVPRLTAQFRLDDPALPAAVAEAAVAIRAAVDAPFDSVGLNLYRDRHDSVAPHNDKLRFIAPGHPIALLSLGATRCMTIRAKQPPRRVLNIDLEPGSLLVMDYATQFHYDHGIPKQRSEVGPRMSLAFRVRGRHAHAAHDESA
jgi:alkylated DNA repair dioxygenase AlkB